MEVVRLVLVFAHLLGFAALLGGLLVQLGKPAKVITPVVRDGIGTAFVAGLLLVAVLEAAGSPDHVKVAVKFAIGLVILVLVMANLRRERVPDGLFYGVLALTLADLAVAVFWAPAHVS